MPKERLTTSERIKSSRKPELRVEDGLGAITDGQLELLRPTFGVLKTITHTTRVRDELRPMPDDGEKIDLDHGFSVEWASPATGDAESEKGVPSEQIIIGATEDDEKTRAESSEEHWPSDAELLREIRRAEIIARFERNSKRKKHSKR